MGKALERALWRMYAPHKVKLAVSGCPRNCAESGIKDVGVIAVESGWEIYVAGNGGIKTEVAQFLVKVQTSNEVLEYAGAFLELYRQEGFYLERTVHFVARVGLDYVKRQNRRGRARDGGHCGSSCSSRSPTSRIPGISRSKPAWTCGNTHRSRRLMNGWIEICALDRHSAARCARPAARRRDSDRAVSHRRGQGVRAARSLPASRRAAVAGPRHRRPGRVSFARLDDRAFRRPGGRARRGLRAGLCGRLRDGACTCAKRMFSLASSPRRRGPSVSPSATRTTLGSRLRGNDSPAMNSVRTTCPYCGVGCGVRVETAGGRIVGVRGDEDHPANRGQLCSKGVSLAATLGESGRALFPELRRERGSPRERVSWDTRSIMRRASFAEAITRRGPDSVAFYCPGSCSPRTTRSSTSSAKGLSAPTTSTRTRGFACRARSPVTSRRLAPTRRPAATRTSTTRRACSSPARTPRGPIRCCSGASRPRRHVIRRFASSSSIRGAR